MKTFPVTPDVMLERGSAGEDGQWFMECAWQRALSMAFAHGWDPADRAGLMPEGVGRLLSAEDARAFGDALEAGIEALCSSESLDAASMREHRDLWDALVRFCRSGAFRIVRFEPNH